MGSSAVNAHRGNVDDGHRPVVLVVEDDEGIRDAIAWLLEDEGFTVRLAANGLEAMNFIAEAETSPALIVLDLMMPVMDGWTFCRVRQGVRALMAIPVLVMSASPMVGSREPLCADAVISKPLDTDKLAALANRLARAKS